MSATLATALLAGAERQPRREALTCGATRLRYGELAERVRRLAAALHTLGVAPGERVGLLLPSGPHYVEAFFAVAARGAVSVPVDPRVPPDEIARVVADAAPKLVLAHAPGTPPSVAAPVLAARPDAGVPLVEGASELTAAERGPAPVREEAAPSDLAVIFYTAGTSGAAVGVMHTHASLLRTIAMIDDARRALRPGWSPRRNARILALLVRHRHALAAAARERVVLTLPGLHNISGSSMMLGALLTGARLVVMERFHPRRALELVETERVTVLGATPVMLELMLRAARRSTVDTRSLFNVGIGGELASPGLVERLRERFGCEVTIGYGATELGGVVARTTFHDDPRVQRETVGHPIEGVETRVVDGDRRPCPAGAIGELACRVEPMMVGYWRAPDRTARAVDADGWYYTGDVAAHEPDGAVRVLGRAADAIMRRGTLVHPAEVESVLEEHPCVAEAAVVGVTVGADDAALVASVVAAPGAPEPAAPELLEHCRRRLPPGRVPEEVRVRPALPRTPDGKVRRAVLRGEALADWVARGTRERVGDP